MSQPQAARPAGGPPKSEAPDLHEHGGPKDGQPQKLDKRLYFQLQAFTGALDLKPLAAALSAAKLPCVLYADANDPRGAAVLTFSEDPGHFLGAVRETLSKD